MKGFFTKQEMSYILEDMLKSHEFQQLSQIMERVMCFRVLHILWLLVISIPFQPFSLTNFN